MSSTSPPPADSTLNNIVDSKFDNRLEEMPNTKPSGLSESNNNSTWQRCLDFLENDLSEQQMNTWVRPLKIIESSANTLVLQAPNRFVKDWVVDNYLEKINKINNLFEISTSIVVAEDNTTTKIAEPGASYNPNNAAPAASSKQPASRLNPDFLLENFVRGRSNELAFAAACRVAEGHAIDYNPLYIYGGVGLGKTHLMHAIGNGFKQQRQDAKVVYLNSERFVQDMVKAMQHNRLEAFKTYYRTADALLIDDIQFLAGKERSQEEFFHTFNALIEGQRQIVLTCDRYPKEVDGLEDRLKSRFGWGLTVAIDPPELETRAAILLSKAEQLGLVLTQDVAFFIGKRFPSNVRELEGALRRVAAHHRLKGGKITLASAELALQDMLKVQERMVSMDNIQKTVCDYYALRIADLLGKSRSRSIARPRQIAMALAKELTRHSLPEIGRAFGGRDHTTVLHAERKITELRETDSQLASDYVYLSRILTS